MTMRSAPWRDVPDGWELRPLLAVAEENQILNTGMAETNLLSLSYGRIVRRDIEGLDGLLPASFETYQIVEAGDIVCRFTDLQNDKRSLRTGLVTERGIITSAYTVLKPRCLPRWMSYLLRAYDHQKVFYGFGGGVRQSLKFADVKRLPILLPQEAEQRAIVDFLDRETAWIDAMVDAQERLVALLEERRAAAATRAATLGLDNAGSTRPSGEPWFDRVPEHWSVIPGFAALELIQTGPFGSQVHAEDYVEDGTPLINPAHMVAGALVPDPKVAVSEEKAEDLSRHLLQPGDVIAARRGELGRCAVVRDSDPRALCGTGSLLMRVRSDQFDARYFAEIFSSEPSRTALLQNSVGSTMDNLNAAMVSRMRFPCPPLPEQRAIVDYIRSTTARTDAMIAKARESIALMKERRAAVISAAVTGRIDIRTGIERAERDLEEARA